MFKLSKSQEKEIKQSLSCLRKDAERCELYCCGVVQTIVDMLQAFGYSFDDAIKIVARNLPPIKEIYRYSIPSHLATYLLDEATKFQSKKRK